MRSKESSLCSPLTDFMFLPTFSTSSSHRKLKSLSLVIVAQLALFANSVYAESVERTPPSKNVEVSVGAFLVDLTKINGSEQIFSADMVVRISWLDPRLADASASNRTMELGDVWHPRMVITNFSDVKMLLPKVVEVEPNGMVHYRQRGLGDYTARLNLRQFPNDTQSLGIQIVAQGYTPEQVSFVVDPSFTGRAEQLTISDWLVGEVKVRRNPYIIPKIGELAGVRLEFETKRHLGYYMATIFASAAIIVCMAWMVFWMPAESVNPRISISVTSMLTLIAHRFVVGGELPKLAYLTLMDYFLLGATFMVLLGLVGVVTVARVTSNGDSELGLRLNKIFRWVYPILFFAMVTILI